MSCRICNNNKQNERLIAREMVFGSREEFPYILCSSCGSLSIEKIPSQELLLSLYSRYPNLAKSQFTQSYWQKWIKSYVLSHDNFIAKCLLKLLNSYDDLRIKALFPYKIPKTAKILDVGSGSGSLISELRDLGYKHCLGIDPFLDNDLSLCCGGEILSIDILEFKPTASNFGAGENHDDFLFDWIFFHHSFEHVPNPAEVLKKIENLLTPGGICLLRFPRIESYSFSRFKGDWEGIHSPFHFFLPSYKGMQHLLQNTSMEIIETRGEQLYYLFLYTVSHILNIADFEPLGVRNQLQNNSRETPSIFSEKEVRYWKRKTKHVLKDNSSDYVGYYLKKKLC